MAICVGCGLAVNGSGVLIVDRNPDTVASGIDCVDSLGLSLSIQHTDGTCVTTTGLGTAASPLRAEINIADSSSGLICDGTGLRTVASSDSCNGTTIRAGGIWSPAMCTTAGTASTGYAGAIFPVNLNVGGAEYNIINFGGPISIVNPLNCEIKGRWDVQAFGGRVIAQPGFYGYAFLVTNINGAGFGAASPLTFQSMDNRASAGGDPNGGVVEYYISRHHEENYIAIPALGTVTIEAGIRVHVNTPIASWVDTPQFPGFEFHWHLTPTGVC